MPCLAGLQPGSGRGVCVNESSAVLASHTCQAVSIFHKQRIHAPDLFLATAHDAVCVSTPGTEAFGAEGQSTSDAHGNKHLIKGCCIYPLVPFDRGTVTAGRCHVTLFEFVALAHQQRMVVFQKRIIISAALHHDWASAASDLIQFVAYCHRLLYKQTSPS